MPNGRLNVAIIGAGRVAHTHAQSIHALEVARLAGAADIEGRRAEEFAAVHNSHAYPSVEALLEDRSVDAVVICSPTVAHAEQAVLASELGKHVLCEKPIALNLEEADRMIAAARQAGVILMIGHVLRFMPEYVLAHEVLQNGELGMVHALYAARMSGMAHTAWQGWLLDSRYGLGVLDAQIHDLDFLHWVLGPPHTITSRGWRAPAGGWIHADSVVVHDDACWAVVQSSFAPPSPYPFTMHLRAIGDKGTLEYQFLGESYSGPHTRRLLLYSQEGRMEEKPLPVRGPYADQMQHFVSAVQRDQPPFQGRAEDARAALKMALAVHESLSGGGLPIHLAP